MKNFLLILAAIFAPLWASVYRARRGLEFLANAAGIHPSGVRTFLSESDMTGKQHYLVKRGTNPALQCEVISSVSDKPLGFCADEPLVDGECAVKVLGAVRGTVIGIAHNAITAGNRVLSWNTGQVLDETTAGVSTYYIVGIAMNDAADGEEVEIALAQTLEQVTVS